MSLRQNEKHSCLQVDMKFDMQLKALLLYICSATFGIKDHLLLISLLSLINILKVAVSLPKSNIHDH